MKTTVWMATLCLGLMLALTGCPKDEGTDATTGGTDSTVAPTDGGGGGTDAAFVCAMTGGTCDDWCASYLANCATDDNFPAGYDNTMCQADCAGLAPADVECRAYHACFSGKGGLAMADAHCDHAIGLMICG